MTKKSKKTILQREVIYSSKNDDIELLKDHITGFYIVKNNIENRKTYIKDFNKAVIYFDKAVITENLLT